MTDGTHDEEVTDGAVDLAQEGEGPGESKPRPTAEERRSEFAQRRHQSRTLALEMLFEADFGILPPEAILVRRRSEESLSEAVWDYSATLLYGAWSHREEYDRILAAVAPSWPLEQMARMDRTILRLAMYELLERDEVPVKALINEAVELAKEYGTDASRRFINGVLGTLAAEHPRPRVEAVAPGGK